MLTEHEARALLIRNGYKLDPNYTFYFPVVKDARFKDVKQLLDEAGYDGRQHFNRCKDYEMSEQSKRLYKDFKRILKNDGIESIES